MRMNVRRSLQLGVAGMAMCVAATIAAQAPAPANPGREIPPPALPQADTGKPANLASQLPPARTPIAAASGEAPARYPDTPPLDRLEDPPRLPPMRLTQPPASTAPALPPLISETPVVVDDVRDGAIRTGVRVTTRNGMSYTLTDPRHEGAYKQNEGSPLAGKAAVPRWQVLKW